MSIVTVSHKTRKIKEPWATPNRATPESFNPVKQILKGSKKNQKKQKQTFQQINPNTV